MMSPDANGRIPAPWVGRPGALVFTVACLLVVLVFLQTLREAKYEVDRVYPQTLYVSSGTTLRQLALSFDSVLADIYWIRAIQHYGGTRRDDTSAKEYELLYPLLDIATTLDPRFNIAYRFGAIFLAEVHPNGPGRPDWAVALLQKGVHEVPDRWQYLQDIGFVYYWWQHDYEEAARWFRRASEIPGSPWWLRSLAANTLAVGGNRADSRVLWREIHESSDNEWMRQEAQRRLLQLDALDQVEQYRVAVERFTEREGSVPALWRDVIGNLVRPAAPLDPTGYPYVLDPLSGAVSVSPQSPLFPLPDELRAMGSP